MKKGVTILLLALFLSSFLIVNVSAAVDTKNAFKPIVDMVSGLIQNIYEAAKPGVQLLLGDTGGNAGISLAKFLFLIVLFALISSILGASGVDFLQSGWTRWIISGAVSILGIYFLTPDLIRTMIIPNSTLGVVLTSLLPFGIYFMFVEKALAAPRPAILRRAAWILYAVVFLIVWIMTQDQIKEPLVITLYPLVILLCFIMALMDGTIQHFFNKAKASRASAGAKASHAALVQDDMDKAIEAYRKNPTTYRGRTFSGTNKTGKVAYLADMKEYQDTINNIFILNNLYKLSIS